MGPSAADNPSLDDDLLELQEIRRRLDEVVDVAERVSLTDRQRELRRRWAGSHESVSTARLQELEKALSAQRAEVFERHLNVGAVAAASGYGGGLDPLQTIQHNRAVDETHGLAAIEQQLGSVRSELRKRGGG